MIKRVVLSVVLGVVSTIAVARTAEVIVTEAEDAPEPTVILSFTDHDNETNGLWIAFGREDMGDTTNGWEYVEFLATVYPETESVEYQLPVGWGGTSLRAARFFLSEVPYGAIDYTTEYLFSEKGSASVAQVIHLNDFTFYGTDRVYARVKFQTTSLTRAQGIFCARQTTSGPAPYFNIFCLASGLLRFDYNDATGSAGKGLGTTLLDRETTYEIEASSDGLLLNGYPEAVRPSTHFSTAASGTPFLFAGSRTAVSSQAKMYLYNLRVYDQYGALRMNLIPIAKDSVGGVYDTVRHKLYFGMVATWGAVAFDPGPRVEALNPFFTNAIYQVEESSGASVFTTFTSAEDANSYENLAGGVLVGTGDLTLSGQNDFGGLFTVSNGTLVADFGQGLGANDNLLLAGGAWGGWEGLATNSIGVGGGEISFADDLPGGWSAAAGDLTVNIGGEGATWSYNGVPQLLILNDMNAKGTLTFDNPIYLGDNVHLDVTNMAAPVVFTRAINSLLTSSGGSIYTYGDAEASGVLIFTAPTNSYKTFYQYGGNTIFATNTYTRLGGNFYVEGGTVLLTNAVLKQTGEAGYASTARPTAGHLRLVGSLFTTRGLIIGAATGESNSSVTVDNSELNVSGEVTINMSTQSAAFNILGNSTVNIGGDLFLGRRNVYQYSGTNVIAGGVMDISASSTARYALLGGYLSATNIARRAGVTSPAYFVFNGGTLKVTGAGGEIFLNFAELPGNGIASRIDLGGLGGTIEVVNDCWIAAPLVTSTFVDSTWAYNPEQYLTAPAFVKRGGGKLTLAGANATYKCAVEVAEGTLEVAAECATALSSISVVRLTGGTLNLGENTVAVKALTGSGSGSVVNGTLAVSEGIYPGGAGTVGDLRTAATLAGTLYVDVEEIEEGLWRSDKLIVDGALDLTDLDLDVVGLAGVPREVKVLRIVEGGAYVGRFNSVANVPNGWSVSYSTSGVTLQRPGLLIMIK